MRVEQRWHARHVLTTAGWLSDATVVVDDQGRISAIGAGDPRSVAPDGDFARCDVLAPAMPDAHCHAFQYAIAGRAERAGRHGDSFWHWRERMYEAAQRLDPEALHAIARTLYRRLRAGGYGSVAEFHYVHRPSGQAPLELADALIAAAREAGLGMLLLPVYYRRGGFADAPLGSSQRSFELSLDDYGELLGALAPRLAEPGEALGIAPHSLRAVGPTDLAELLSLRRQLVPDCPVHIHVSEQRAEIDAAIVHLGAAPVEWLCDHVDLDRNWVLVHATHTSARERARVAAAGATICICTTTEANLGDGLFDIADWWAQGGSLAIGSDSNVGCDASEELRWLEYQARLASGRRAVLVDAATEHPGTALWARAVAGGQRALGRDAAGIRLGATIELLPLACEDPSMTADEIVDDWVFARRATRRCN